MDLCLGDDNQSLDDDFDAWREQMWEVLSKMSKKNGGGDVEKDHHKQQQLIDLPSLNYTIQFVKEGGNSFEKKNNNSTPKKRVYKARAEEKEGKVPSALKLPPVQKKKK